MFNLLKNIRPLIGLMNFDNTCFLIYRSVIIRYVEGFVCQSENVNFFSLRFNTKVKITGIMPCADIKSRHNIAGFVLCEGRWPLKVSIEVIQTYRGHRSEERRVGKECRSR